MPYCDGGSFSGNNESIALYKNTKLHFRGKRIREAAVARLMKDHGLDKATDVVISGCSAGGLATFLHTDQWCDVVRGNGAKCVGMPDSGFFLDYQNGNESPPSPPRENAKRSRRTTIPGDYHAGLKWCFEMFNATEGVNPSCSK